MRPLRTSSMRHDIIDRQAQAMNAGGLDAILSCSPENFAYVTGFLSPTQKLMRWRHAMALVKADGTAALVVVDMEASTIRARAGEGIEIAVWREFAFEAMKVAADLLRRHGLARGAHRPRARLPAGCRFRRARRAAAVGEIRRRAGVVGASPPDQDADEIDLLRRLSRVADRGIASAFGAVGAGATEMDIAAALTRSVYEQGAESFTLMIVATGERSVFPNVGPTSRVLARGDVCRVEIFPIIGGYHAGVCRTAVVETAPPQAERIWANLTACKHMLLDTMKPGASSRAIYERYLAKTEELALPRISFVGHGIGLHLHEDPYLGPTADQPLEPGMVLGIEPLIYQTGFGFGMQNKDMVLVTERGCELLSDVTDTDRLMVVR